MARQRSNVYATRQRLNPRREERPLFYGGMDPITLNRMEKMVQNVARTMSGSWMDRFRTGDPSQDPRRSIDDECGYPSYPWSSEEYHDLIMRDPLAALCNEFYPIESWPVLPELYDNDDEGVGSDFELAFDEFATSLGDPEPNHFADPNSGSSIWSTCLCADILCGEGRHGGVYIDFDDGKDPAEPVTKRQGMKVRFLQALPEYMCRVSSFDDNPESIRKGMPSQYQVWFADPHETTSTGINESFTSAMVHASRIVHVVDRWHAAPVSRNFAVPRLRQLRDPILDARKVRGGASEGYWKGMFMGLHFGTHPQLGADVNVNVEQLRDMYEEYQNGMQRGVFTKGMFVDPLAPQVADPEKHLLANYEAICIKMRAPMRLVIGSEVGQLATEKDLVRHYNRVRGRQTGHNNPNIIYPLVNRLINFGALPEPQKENKSGSKSGGAKVHWPDVATQSDKEKADALLVRVQAYGQYVANDVASIVPPLEFMTEFDDVPKERAEAILDAAEEQQIEKDEEAQRLADEHGLVPDLSAEGFKEPTPEPDPEGDHKRAIELERVKASVRKPPTRNRGDYYVDMLQTFLTNIYCATGDGGGIDPTCLASSHGGGGTPGPNAEGRYPSKHNPDITYGNKGDRDKDDVHFDKEIKRATTRVERIKKQIAEKGLQHKETVKEIESAAVEVQKHYDDKVAHAHARVEAAKKAREESSRRIEELKAEIAVRKNKKGTK